MIKQKYHPKWRGSFARGAWTGTGFLGAVSLLGLAGRLHWMLDLLTHFRVQYVQLALVLAGICLWMRLNKAAIALILIGLFNYAYVYPLYLGRPEAPTEKPVRAMLMNLNASNGHTEQVLKTVGQFDPDILLLEEVTPKWAKELQALHGAYLHRLDGSQEGCFGIMLLSKYPMGHAEFIEIGDAGLPSIRADIYLPEHVFTLIGTHPLPPVGRGYAMHRNNQLAALPELIKSQTRPVLLIGDLNTSPWSPYFRDLLRDSGLKNSMKGFGFQPSWPAQIRLLRIPIDHMLYADGITIHNRMVGGDVGSDHFPVIVDFSFD